MTILDLKPFFVVEDAGFNQLLTHLCPNYTMPSRKYVSGVVDDIANKLKSAVKGEIAKAVYISLTSDGWIA